MGRVLGDEFGKALRARSRVALTGLDLCILFMIAWKS